MVNGPSIVGGQWSKDMKTFFKAILFRSKKGKREGGRKVLDENNSPNY
jgi:hypothetical protein